MRKIGTLKDIMTTDLTVVKLDTPLKKIKHIFDTESFHHLPVVDKMGMIMGIISRNDFTNLAMQLSANTAGKIYSEKWFNSLTAKEVMTKKPVFLGPDDSIGLAADLFLENIYHAIPVMEDEALVGIVTTHDLLAYAFYDAPVGGEK